MGTPLLAGRDFDDRDSLSTPGVAIVNETFARRYFGAVNPVGRRFRVEANAGEADPLYDIVGLVKDAKYYNLRESFRPTAYLPAAQDRDPGPYASFMVRSSGPLRSVMSAVKQAVGEVHPAIGIEFRGMSAQVRESLLRERLMATLSGFFGGLAGLLAAIGLYGVLSYMVARRQNEIGVRMALGADAGAILAMILREAAALVSSGLLAGVILAMAAATTAETLLFGLQPHDPWTISVAAATLAAVALLAGGIPARRAARLDPTVALREE
jgi:predicted permease